MEEDAIARRPSPQSSSRPLSSTDGSSLPAPPYSPPGDKHQDRSASSHYRTLSRTSDVMSPISADGVYDVAESLSRLSIRSAGSGSPTEGLPEVQIQLLDQSMVGSLPEYSAFGNDIGHEEYEYDEEREEPYGESDQEYEDLQYDDEYHQEPEPDTGPPHARDNNSVSTSEINISLPSVEPSFTGSLVEQAPSPSPTLVRATSQAAKTDELLASPQISPSPSPPLPDTHDLELETTQSGADEALQDVTEEEDEDGFDASPLLKKSATQKQTLANGDETPKPSKSTSNTRRQKPRPRVPDPTETAIASRVKNITVSDSAVKDFALRHSQRSRRSATGTTTTSSTTQNSHTTATSTSSLVPPYTASKPTAPNTVASKLTLKEQSALIDKLQKDNWGYQLKIYILQEELDKRSEDSVRDLRNENVEFKSINVGLNIEIKKLNRKIIELEARLRKAETERAADQEKDERVAVVEAENREEIEALRAELENYMNLVEDLKVELEATRDKVQELQENEGQYKVEIQQWQRNQKDEIFEEEIATLKRFLEKEQLARDIAQKDVIDLRTELLKVRRSASTMGGSDRETSAELNKLRQDNRDLRRELVNQATLSDASNLEKERLYHELEDLKRSLRRSSSSATSSRRSLVAETEDYEAVISDLRDKVSEVKFIARERKTQVDILNKENADMQDVIENLQSTVQTLTEDKGSLQADVSQLLKEAAAREEEIVTWQEDYEVLSTEADAELTRLSDLVKAKDVEFTKLNAEIDSFTRLVTAFERESEALKNEIKEYRDKVAEHERIAERLRAKLNETKTDMETQLLASQDDNVRERERLNDLRRRAQEAEAASRDLRKQIQELQDDNARERARYKDLRRQVQETEAVSADLRKQLQGAKAAVAAREHIDMRIQDYENAMVDLEKQLENLQRENEARADARAEWTQKVAEYDATIAGLEKKLSDAQDRNNVLQQLANGTVNSKNSQLQGSTLSSKSSINGGIEHLLGSSTGSMSASTSTDKWMIRLQELEQRLKAEREARIRDRDGARQRLDEALRENDELKGALSKARSRTTGTFGTLGPLSGAFVRSFAAPMTSETKPVSDGSLRRSARLNNADDVDDDVDSH
ncbi:hypothetical protein V1508DRAFT_366261 [Lipomyces doorenjongii]|uniref:uncharacterized protein n=1 Tax=Lipomyces doorenjongii TaxID=383834 RepID=UPI0034CD271C